MSKYNRGINRNVNVMTLNTAGFSPAVFNPMEFAPVEADINIIHKAMATQEERRLKANEQVSNVKSALGKAREALHKDDETLGWFDNKAREIEDRLNAAASVGDYVGALNFAIQEAGDLANDIELNTRIRTNSEYETQMNRLQQLVDNKVISQETANYYKKTNPYVYNPIKDDNGKIIGANKFELSTQPVADLDVNKLFINAFRMITPNKTSGSGDNYSTNIGADGLPTNITVQHQKSIENVSPKDILQQARTILFADNDWEAKVQQMYNVAFDKYTTNKQRLDELINNGDIKSQEYQVLSTIVNQEEEMFYPNGNAQELNSNTFLNFFDRQILNSDSARKLGYYYETSSQSNIYNAPKKSSSDDNSDLDEALNDEANTATISYSSTSTEVIPLFYTIKK